MENPMASTSPAASFDRARTALVLIEFQKEWLDPELGRLDRLVQDRAAFSQSATQAKRLTDAARAAGLRIVHVPCLFQPGYPEIAGGLDAGLFHAIPKAGTWIGAGRPFAEGFEPAAGEFVVSGRVGASAFSHSNLDIYLRSNGLRHLLLAGYATHVCVESTLRQGHDLGYRVTLISDACAAFTRAQQSHVLDEVVHHFGDALRADVVLQRLAN
jgi:nicotinamidase-related amidase